MEAISLCSSVFLSNPRSVKFFSNATTRRSLISASKSDSFGHHYDGKMVDQNMMLLRMRIFQIEMKTMDKVPSDWSEWSEWEKEDYENHVLQVCKVLGLLQRLLINTRPSFAVAAFVLIILAMSMSIVHLLLLLVQLLHHFVVSAKGII